MVSGLGCLGSDTDSMIEHLAVALAGPMPGQGSVGRDGQNRNCGRAEALLGCAVTCREDTTCGLPKAKPSEF